MKLFPLDENARSQPFDAVALKASIVEAALRAGAGAVRVVSADADEQSRERLARSFERGDLSTWPYTSEYAQRASDPRTLLPDAKSVVCVAVPYASTPPKRRPLEGRVSNYAWSEDYHRRMRALLDELARTIDAAAGAAVTASACDTKPLAERALAARSGLGWIGKHTNLIAPKLGSYVFLGEVVTSLELPPDEPLRKSCGSCARCVDVCPTGALRGDYTIDANRCIADLTQRTDSIPREMRPMIGDWVWGCDLCQDVCPPTLRASRQHEAFAPIDERLASPSLVDLLSLRSGEFKRGYARTAMGWRGSAVLRRNAAIALGNALDRSAVDALARSLRSDPHPMVRGAAAWALGRIGSPQALACLEEACSLEGDDSVLEELAAALEPWQASPALG